MLDMGHKKCWKEQDISDDNDKITVNDVIKKVSGFIFFRSMVSGSSSDVRRRIGLAFSAF